MFDEFVQAKQNNSDPATGVVLERRVRRQHEAWHRPRVRPDRAGSVPRRQPALTRRAGSRAASEWVYGNS